MGKCWKLFPQLYLKHNQERKIVTRSPNIAHVAMYDVVSRIGKGFFLCLVLID